jgi:hypothetical protein
MEKNCNYTVLDEIEKDLSYSERYNAYKDAAVAEKELENYVNEITNIYIELRKLATTDKKQKVLDKLFSKFKFKYLSKKKKTLKEMGENENTQEVEKAEKDLELYREEGIAEIKMKIGTKDIIRNDDPNALTKLKNKLESLENENERSKVYNAIINSKKYTQEQKLTLLQVGGASKELIEQQTKDGKLFPIKLKYGIIRSTKQRISLLENKK